MSVNIFPLVVFDFCTGCGENYIFHFELYKINRVVQYNAGMEILPEFRICLHILDQTTNECYLRVNRNCSRAPKFNL